MACVPNLSGTFTNFEGMWNSEHPSKVQTSKYNLEIHIFFYKGFYSNTLLKSSLKYCFLFFLCFECCVHKDNKNGCVDLQKLLGAVTEKDDLLNCHTVIKPNLALSES